MFSVSQVNQLVQQRSKLQTRIEQAEEAKARLLKQLEAVSEKLKSKHERAVQIGKEKICFTSFNKHELAVFLPNDAGHYEAVNCNCPHYFLSEESVLLFKAHQPETAHKYIVAQIVHIDHNVARPPSPGSLAGGLVEGKNGGGGQRAAVESVRAAPGNGLLCGNGRNGARLWGHVTPQSYE